MSDNSTISSKIQSGSKTIKEKISSIFKFKKTPPQSSSISQPNETPLPKDNSKNNNKIQQEKKRVFNIQLSEEDKENVYDINDDDEYEEEEEAEEIEDNHKEGVNCNKDQSNNINGQNTKEDNPDHREDQELEVHSNSIDMICHYLHPKGTVIDTNDVDIHRFIKIKQAKKGMLSIFGFGNKKQTTEIEINYLAFFDENYLYFMKDTEFDPNNKAYRLIGNRFNLLKMYNAFFDQISNNRWKIRLEFASSTEINNINKVMIFDKESVDRFYETLNVYFKRLNMKMSDTEQLQQSKPSSS